MFALTVPAVLAFSASFTAWLLGLDGLFWLSVSVAAVAFSASAFSKKPFGPERTLCLASLVGSLCVLASRLTVPQQEAVLAFLAGNNLEGFSDWDLGLWSAVLRFWPFLAVGTFLYAGWFSRLKSKSPARPPERLSPPRPVSPRRKSPGDVEIAPGLVLNLEDRYLHTLVVGTTGTGKTSRVLKPLVWQDLETMKSGFPFGVTVIEPKGDLADDVAAMAEDLGIPYVYLNPLDPSTHRFNPFEGPADEVAAIAKTVFRSLFGRQEAFWSHYQDAALVNVVKLLKGIMGDDLTIAEVREALSNYEVLKKCVGKYELSGGLDSVITYFKSEVLKDAGEAWHKHATGLRAQLDGFVADEAVMRVLGGRSDFSLDSLLAEGGLLIANTCAGRGDAGDAFGKFLMMHLQQAVFRRTVRTPHVLYVDEFPRYVNYRFADMLAMGRGYCCAAVLAVQNTDQVVLKDNPGFRSAVVGNCRNKVLLNLEPSDAASFSKECGEEWAVQKGYKRSKKEWSVDEKAVLVPRFSPTDLMELPPYTAVCLLVRGGAVQKPVLVSLSLSPWDQKRGRRPSPPKPEAGQVEIKAPLRAESPPPRSFEALRSGFIPEER